MLAWLAAAIAGIWLSAIFWLALRGHVPGDFSSFYCGGELLRTRGPAALYDFRLLEQCTAARFPNSPPLPYIRPPFYALALAPLSLFRPDTALVLWLALNALALITAVLLTGRLAGLDTPEVAWLGAIFFPALATLLNRQDVPFVLLLAVASYRLARTGREFAAGAVLALCTIKFHLLLLVPLPWLVQRKWRGLAGLAAGAGALAVASLLLVGPGGLVSYARMLLDRSVPNIQTNPGRIANLAQLTGAGWLAFPFIGAAIAAVVLAARRLGFLQAQAAAWLGSLAVAPHIHISDFLAAFPALLLLAPVSRVSRLAAIPLLFPLIPAMLVFSERWVVAAPLLSLVAVLGAAIAPGRGTAQQPPPPPNSAAAATGERPPAG